MRANKITILAVIIVVSGLAGNALADLLAHYTFDDSTADDLSGYDRHGTLEGGASITYDAAGQWNKDPSYVLDVGDYVNGYVNCGGGNGGWGDIPQEAVTIAAWYKAIDWNANFSTIVSKGFGDTDGYLLSRYGRENNVTFTCMSVPAWDGLPSTDPCAWDGEWHHVVGVYTTGIEGPDEWRPAESKIYVDGILSNSAEKWGSVGIGLNEWDVIIGGEGSSIAAGIGYRFFNGLIDDVRVYDEALNASTISDIYMGNTPDITLTLNVEPNNVGIDTVTPGVGQHLYYPNQPVHLTANDFAGCPDVCKFVHWEGDVADANAANTKVIMDEDKAVTAVFVDTRECGDQCHPILAGDLNGDCYINFEDFAIYCEQWLSCTHPNCD